MKISELLEELGVIQGEHGDIDVYLGDRFRSCEALEPADKVTNAEVFSRNPKKESETCVLIINC